MYPRINLNEIESQKLTFELAIEKLRKKLIESTNEK